MKVGIAKFHITDKKLNKQKLHFIKYGCDKTFELKRANPKLFKDLLIQLSYQKASISAIIFQSLDLFKANICELNSFMFAEDSAHIEFIFIEDHISTRNKADLKKLKERLNLLRERKKNKYYADSTPNEGKV